MIFKPCSQFCFRFFRDNVPTVEGMKNQCIALISWFFGNKTKKLTQKNEVKENFEQGFTKEVSRSHYVLEQATNILWSPLITYASAHA